MSLEYYIGELRQQLINIENLNDKLKPYKTRNSFEAKVKIKLLEFIKTIQADIFLTYEFLIEAGDCSFESDLDLIINDFEEVES